MRYIFRILSIIVVLLFATSCGNKVYYTNSDGSEINKPLASLLQWRLQRDSPKPKRLIVSSEWKQLRQSDNHYAIWIGHSTFLINNGDLQILTDPIFSDRASPFSWIGPRRLVPPAMRVDQVSDVDVVTISHNHYDHLDISSLISLQKSNPKCLILVPMGDKKLLDTAGIKNVFEFDWWDSIKVNNTKFFFTPAQHWSARGLTDRNLSHWGGWYIQTPEMSLYHVGDSGYSEDFRQVRERLGSPKYAFIPIGAYAPRWFMKSAHVDPAEAFQIAIDVGAEYSVAMHWGTFSLSDEPTFEPLLRLQQIRRDSGLPENYFFAPEMGEIIYLDL
ncbi:MAG: MBL fold metallo-hydrolase [Porticoccaceae bacterium]|nr:MBL fold metallo-hydrolase [Porticoccaceae bacterium]